MENVMVARMLVPNSNQIAPRARLPPRLNRPRNSKQWRSATRSLSLRALNIAKGVFHLCRISLHGFSNCSWKNSPGWRGFEGDKRE